MLGDHSAKTFEPLWAIVGAWQCYFYVTDGWSVYPGFIPSGDQIVSKTYMTRVEGENTRKRHYLARLHRQTLCYSCVSRNAETFNPLVTSLLEILGCPNSCLIPPIIQQRHNLNNLRWWYRASQLLEKSSQYLKDIADVVQVYKQGKPMSPSCIAAMQQDVTQIMDVWEKAATEAGKSQRYQNRIAELKGQWLAGKQLPTKPLDFMERDIQQQRRQSQGKRA